MARPLIQMALDSLDFDVKPKKELYIIYDISRNVPNITFTKAHIPKPSKNMYQTKRGKWINYK